MQLPSKKLMIPMAALAIVGVAGAYGVSAVSADSSSTDPQGSLVQKLADKFHIDKTQVQAVFDADRAEHQAKQEDNYKQRLEKAVTDGKLTSAQKDAVLTEHNKLAAEMKAAMEQSSGSDPRTAMEKIKKEAQDWATQNNIDAKWLMGFGGMKGGHGGPGGPGGMGMGHGEMGSTRSAN